jgi:hypothetical protein
MTLLNFLKKTNTFGRAYSHGAAKARRHSGGGHVAVSRGIGR